MESKLISHSLDVVQELSGTWDTCFFQYMSDDIAKGFLGQYGVDIPSLRGYYLIEEDAPYCGIYQFGHYVAMLIEVVSTYLDRGIEVYLMLVVGNIHLLWRVEYRALACDRFLWSALAHLGDVVKPQDHVLRRYGNRCPIGRVQDIIGSQHEHLCLKDRLRPKGQVYGHLVTVKVGVERSTY